MIRPLSFAVLSALALQGCMFSPGQNLDTGRLMQEDSAESSRVQLVQITPKLLAVEAATQQQSSVPQKLIDYHPESYRIGPGDLLYITVWDHPELTTPAGQQQQLDANGRLVRPDGSLFYPYIGQIKVGGRTIEAVRGTITNALAAYVEQPQVDIAVMRYGSQRVVLNGAFLKAGPQAITATPLSLMEAIGSAELDTTNADLSGLTLKRDNQVYRLDLDALNTAQDSDLYSLYLKDGDRIYLPYNDRKKVYLMGEVNAPRALTFKTREMNLADALGSVGGLNQTTANGKAVYVIRGVENLETERAKVFQLDANSPTAFILAQQFQLKPQDVVYVGPAGVTRWNRLISQLVPSAGILGTSSSIQHNLNNN
ncbi:polysaccharide biosynthesis/export family protein [Pseudomonas nitroreducens]|uniref:polysaccharide biosynthesis/export family protein n=1 Tax=Pseudomonas nitroreducens TaxID=46680 RepID=UPI00147307F3|nr:polysaccharide biosynthesis/export family protein [Pseudomonas nitroreducens]MDG9857165.1 polysaccharide biosynthesis/export family protein [Pseudomonas nitroreducens]MDH1074296.1 polysaccharide biosynthesis/export family protein [Pseudomonas nitroreducens]NMZ72910.1 capsular biosynthesis protein [Pseudomonas nitroreducens]